MDKTIPASAAVLLRFIYETETGKTAPHCYDVIFGNRQTQLSTPLTQMTLSQIQKEQSVWSSTAWAKKFKSTKASSAAGAPQFMRKTLAGLITELGLSGSQKLDGDLQDRLAYHLLKRRGFNDFMNGRISRTEFGKRLAMEWASFPVLASGKGAHLYLSRGQSYYSGDSLNKALVKPEQVEKILDQIKLLSPSTPEQKPTYPPIIKNPEPVKDNHIGLAAGFFAAITATVIAAWTFLTGLPCNLFGVFCGG